MALTPSSPANTTRCRTRPPCPRPSGSSRNSNHRFDLQVGRWPAGFLPSFAMPGRRAVRRKIQLMKWDGASMQKTRITWVMLHEGEYSFPVAAGKMAETLDSGDQLTMVDSKMNPLVDSPATTSGSHDSMGFISANVFWSLQRSNSGAVPVGSFFLWPAMRTWPATRLLTWPSAGDVADMASVLRDVEAWVRTLQELTAPATASVVLPVAPSDVLMLVEAFSCLVCHENQDVKSILKTPSHTKVVNPTCKKVKFENTLHLSIQTMTAISEGISSNMLITANGKENIKRSQRIVGAYNLRGNHWVGVIICMRSFEIKYFDPISQSCLEGEALTKCWSFYFYLCMRYLFVKLNCDEQVHVYQDDITDKKALMENETCDCS
ncbi:hypothetical protein CAPTEDRAFT_195425 [Capitella teleta]|uniref:Uncharacterized protein n=1 Tax=Capitella teleta TaxID=283909 RepID=R7TJJ3_CAPTE|nr:hypothetical protein CAPTEDRAFT_195425 [Capitella teleta]|eukprot:ELT93854.1 hypothetical protein CAPTEDRAFT_195425 [Capitella teleta]